MLKELQEAFKWPRELPNTKTEQGTTSKGARTDSDVLDTELVIQLSILLFSIQFDAIIDLFIPFLIAELK
jgi:hypothetical protein